MKKNNNDITIQTPIHSGFGPRTMAIEALQGEDLSGKVAIVTGGYSGLGLETTRILAEAGATVIVPARTPEKALASVSAISGVELESLDLLDPTSIDAFAERFLNSNRPLHILVDSAGIMASPLSRDKRGYESQFAINHLGHFQLTAKLWPALVKAEGARVVSVSSRGHMISGIDFSDPNFENREYDKWIAYGQSKTANALFAVELDKRGENYGIRAFSVHPGSIVTDLSRNLSDDEMRAMGALDEHGQRGFSVYNDELKTIPEGAATIVWCAVNKQLEGMGGVYCENVDIAQAVPSDNPPGPGVKPWAVNPVYAEQLWQLSEKLTGVKFPE
ncbi:oxidoreductase [Paenibacillus qinlingensis]|uniref:NAD(P)-dependent dehydrogenase (Short-subunit alcohol dehydrogenase family) n=1 Tax=Paenibacillus qinlingensis TaxID=1837343 RepID=A0ABU1NSF1_9BACL|nr:oxidoreductase [Paenibacillus qinlingensis]MDR6550363.1 NAD(P)-dependent dehydrogenase (short-subunit alcohol dehydrogenase family) [Paenibacillus qinlingensis]